MVIKAKFDAASLGAVKDCERSLHRVIFAANVDLFNACVEGTPVDTNFARGSWWQQSDHQPGTNPSQPTKGGGATTPQSSPAVVMESIGKTYSVANSAAYIRRLEYDGHSKQNRGWVSRAAASYDEFIRRRVAQETGR